jgi:glycosyltransferase involved in cell wall biosynthesis
MNRLNTNKENHARLNNPLGILLLPQTCPPDVGGVETHVLDLIAALKNHSDYRTWIVAYKPIVTNIKTYLPVEVQGNVTIRRFWWIGGNLFRKLEFCPPLVFLYIVPYFMLRLFFYILPRIHQIDVIHTNGLNMAVVGLVFGRIFRKRVIFQSHALYSFQTGTVFAKVASFVIRRMDAVVTLCNASRDEFIKIGVPPDKITVYRYWVDLRRFSDQGRKANNVFTALFAGRLMKIKGEGIVIDLARHFPQINFKIAGCGPNEDAVVNATKELRNLEFLGLVDNTRLNEYYRSADVGLVPSLYPEGVPRVTCEMISCGTPVIATAMGGIPHSVDNTVGILCTPSFESIAAALQRMIDDPAWYRSIQVNCRPYAEQKFSDRNADVIFNAYKPDSDK